MNRISILVLLVVTLWTPACGGSGGPSEPGVGAPEMRGVWMYDPAEKTGRLDVKIGGGVATRQMGEVRIWFSQEAGSWTPLIHENRVHFPWSTPFAQKVPLANLVDRVRVHVTLRIDGDEAWWEGGLLAEAKGKRAIWKAFNRGRTGEPPTEGEMRVRPQPQVGGRVGFVVDGENYFLQPSPPSHITIDLPARDPDIEHVWIWVEDTDVPKEWVESRSIASAVHNQEDPELTNVNAELLLTVNRFNIEPNPSVPAGRTRWVYAVTKYVDTQGGEWYWGHKSTSVAAPSSSGTPTTHALQTRRTVASTRFPPQP